MVVALLPIWLLDWIGTRTHSRRSSSTSVALAFLAGASIAAAAGGYWYWHYYLGLLPPLSLLAGAGLLHLFKPETGARISSAFCGLLSASTFIAVLFTARLVGETPEQTSWNLYRRPAYLANTEIADYVRRHTSETDRIYAAFAQADLYYLSGRRNAGRHLYWTEINRVPGAFEAFLDALDDPVRRPKYIVEIDHYLETPGRAAPFWARVERLYFAETTIRGVTLYRVRDT